MIDVNGAAAQRPHLPCSHGRISLPRACIVKGGAIQYRTQCLDRGEATSGAVAKVTALQATGGNPEPFDEELRTEKQNLWLSNYNEYLNSEAWNIRRRKVWKRCGGICEGCGELPVTEVHHLTYTHIGNELLYELVGLCDTCHGAVHNK